MQYTSVIQRLQNLINREISQAELCRVLGAKQSTISNRQLRNSNFNENEIEIINKHYGIDLYSNITNCNLSDDILLDYFPEVYASCGTGAEPFSTRSEKMNVSKALIKGYDASKKYNVINTTSDSMMPEICPRDFLVIETEPESIKDNHIYVFTYENEIYCKYLCRNLKEIIVRSENKQYNDVYIIGEERQKLKVIGEVVAIIRDYTR